MTKSWYVQASGVALAALSGAIALAPVANAQARTEPSSAQVKSDEEIVVTASRRAERLADVAMSVTALSGEKLNERQILDFQSIAAQVPGFSVQTQSAGFNRLILRGQNSGSVGASVATVIDDMPFNFVTSKGTSGLLAANIDTWDLDRIEVLRGPQGTLYGAAAQGGLIKYVTKAPALGVTGATVEVGAKTVRDGDSAGSGKGWVNIPIGDDFAVRISGAYDSTPGFVDNPTLGQTDFNSSYRKSIRASLLFKPTDTFSARFTSFSQRIDSNGNGAVDVVGAARTPRTPAANRFTIVNGYTQPRLNEAFVDNVIQTYLLDIGWDLGWAQLQSLTSQGRLKTYFTSDITSQNAAPGLTNGQAFAPLWPVPISIRQQQTEQLKKFNQELRLTSKPGKFEWQGGLFYSTEDTIFNQFYFPYNVSNRAPAVGGPIIGGSTQPVAYEERAVFADATYHFTPQFDVSVGARQTDSEQDSTSTLFPGLLYPRFSATRSTVKDSDTTYAISPRWKIKDDAMIYARVASGFRPGGPLYAAPPAPQFYSSDKTINYEIGARSSFFDDRLTADVAVYRIDWTDIQILTRVTVNNITFSTTGNAGKAESNGVEWSFQYRPLQGLSLGLVGAYTDATLSESAPRLGGLAGDQLAYVPKWSNTLNADYERDVGVGYTGFLGATLIYVGDRYSDFSTTSTTTNHDRLPNYTQLNLRAGVRNDRYTVQVYAQNATDEIGIVNYNNSGGANQTGSANITTPRTIGVLLQARY